MLGWLTRTVETVAEPERFELECGCGNRLAGERGVKHQQVRCARCHANLFVLPANVYPLPKPPKSPKTVKAPEKNRPPPASTESKIASSKPAATAPDALAAKNAVAPTGPPQPSLSERWSTGFRAWRSRQLAPGRLIAYGLVTLVAATALGLWHQAAVAAARKSMAPDIVAGLQAFEKFNFLEANAALGRASRAADLLWLKSAESQLIRLHAKEARAAAGLLPASWSELVEEWGELDSARGKGGKPLRRPSRGWMVLDAVFRQVRSRGRKHLWQAELPLRVGERQLRLSVQTPLLQPLVEQTAEPGPVEESPLPELAPAPLMMPVLPAADGSPRVRAILAVHLVSAEATDGTALELVVDSSSAFLWGDYKHYAAIGYVPSDAADEAETRRLLVRQRALQGVQE